MFPENINPTGHKVVDWISHRADTDRNKTAHVDLMSNRSYTYGEMDQRVGKFSGYLLSKGIQRNDRVGYLALNSTELFELLFACWRIGAIPLALNYRLTAHEIAFIVADSSPSAVFYDISLAEVAEQTQGKLETAIEWIALEPDVPNNNLEQAIGAADYIGEMVDQDLHELAALMYSSGTTGMPKGVIITHNMMYNSAVLLSMQYRLNCYATNLAVMPIFHIGGMNIFAMPTYHAGGTNLVMRAFDPVKTLDVINDPKANVTHFLGVPAMYNAMSMMPNFETTDFSRMETLIAGAEAVPGPLVMKYYDKGIILQEGYGMTESSATNCGQMPEDVPNMIGSCGKTVVQCEMKIIKDDGSLASTNEIGELWMRGPTVTPGYWNRPEANAECFVDGWFKSGDVGRKDENGYYYIEDRIKDMYISGGENVYPAEIENVLYQMPQIKEVAVIGVADEQWGETGCAVIALQENESLTQKEIMDFCADKLAKFKQPKHMATIDALPRNATGKVLKFKLREDQVALLAQNH